MNYITTDNTSCIIPNYSNTTYICNPNSYKYKYNSYNTSDDSYVILESSDEDRPKAVKAIYKMGYITRDEANSLISARYAKRNECTTIYCVDAGDKIIIFCTESTSFLEQETLFKFSYDKCSGKVTEEKIDLLEEIN